jgi:hypothetical protein
MAHTKELSNKLAEWARGELQYQPGPKGNMPNAADFARLCK